MLASRAALKKARQFSEKKRDCNCVEQRQAAGWNVKGISAPIFRKEEYGRLKPHLALMQDEIAGSDLYYKTDSNKKE